MNRSDSASGRLARILMTLAVFGLVFFTTYTIHNQAERIKVFSRYMDRAYLHVLRTAGFDQFTASMERLAAGEINDDERSADLLSAADQWELIVQSLAVMVTLKDDGNPKEQRVWWQNYDISMPVRSSTFAQISDASLLPFMLRETSKTTAWGKAEVDLCQALAEQVRQIPGIILAGRSNNQYTEPARSDGLDLIRPQLVEINRIIRDYRPTALMPR